MYYELIMNLVAGLGIVTDGVIVNILYIDRVRYCKNNKYISYINILRMYYSTITCCELKTQLYFSRPN